MLYTVKFPYGKNAKYPAAVSTPYRSDGISGRILNTFTAAGTPEEVFDHYWISQFVAVPTAAYAIAPATPRRVAEFGSVQQRVAPDDVSAEVGATAVAAVARPVGSFQGLIGNSVVSVAERAPLWQLDACSWI